MISSKHTSDEFFESIRVLGELPDEQRQAIARTVAQLVTDQSMERASLPWQKRKPYEFTSHVFGFIGLQDPSKTGPLAISDAGTITPERTLIGKQVRITLDRLRVASYPGKGIHQVLFQFHSEHYVGGQTENLQFSQ